MASLSFVKSSPTPNLSKSGLVSGSKVFSVCAKTELSAKKKFGLAQVLPLFAYYSLAVFSMPIFDATHKQTCQNRGILEQRKRSNDENRRLIILMLVIVVMMAERWQWAGEEGRGGE